jgi:hypothetical protein
MNLSIRKLAIALAVTISSATNLFVQSNPVFARPTIDPVPGVTDGLFNGGLTGDRSCLAASIPDLAAQEIKYTLLRQDSRYRGRVKVTGVIQNVGRRQYVQAAGSAQILTLAESNDTSVSPSLSSFRTIRGRQRISNLAPGEKMEISYEMDWITSNEFPPVYEAKISFVETAGRRVANPDCNTSNNRIQRDSEPVNALFTR